MSRENINQESQDVAWTENESFVTLVKSKERLTNESVKVMSNESEQSPKEEEEEMHGKIEAQLKSDDESKISEPENALDFQATDTKLTMDQMTEMFKSALSLKDEEGNIVNIKLPPGEETASILNGDHEKLETADVKDTNTEAEEYAENLGKITIQEKKQPIGPSGTLIYVEEAFFHPNMIPAITREKFSCVIHTSDEKTIRPEVTSTLYHFKNFNIAGKDNATLIELVVEETLIPTCGKLSIRLINCPHELSECLEVEYNYEHMPENSVTHIRQRSFCLSTEFIPELLIPERFNFDVAFSYMKFSLHVPFYSRTNPLLNKNYLPEPLYMEKVDSF